MTIDTMTPLLEINAGDTAWVLASASLVLFMTPMLAFFYGGMVRAKGVLNMLMMNVVAMGTIGVLWVVWGYSMAFGDPQWGGLIGNPAQYFGLHGVMGTEVGTIPGFVFVAFQSAFAIIATALISGAVADRMKFSAWVVSTILWGLLVYFPAANWVFGTGWILNTMHAVDFAGGTAIHINAGAAALALAVSLKYRFGYDDSLDVVGVHMVGGVLGTVLVGFLADPHAMAEGAPPPSRPMEPACSSAATASCWESRSSVPSR